MWASNPHFPALVRNIWSGVHSLPQTTKLFQVAATLWKKQQFGNIFQQKRTLLARLAGIQASVHYPSSIFLQNLEIDLSMQYSKILRLEEEFWKLNLVSIG